MGVMLVPGCAVKGVRKCGLPHTCAPCAAAPQTPMSASPPPPSSTAPQTRYIDFPYHGGDVCARIAVESVAWVCSWGPAWTGLSMHGRFSGRPRVKARVQRAVLRLYSCGPPAAREWRSSGTGGGLGAVARVQGKTREWFRPPRPYRADVGTWQHLGVDGEGVPQRGCMLRGAGARQ